MNVVDDFMNEKSEQEMFFWKMSVTNMIFVCGAVLFLIFAFSSGLKEMVHTWGNTEEYGHGYLIPIITLFFIWQKKNELAQKEFTGSWMGILCIIFGAILLVFGELGTLYVVTQYAFVVTIFGLALSLLGWQAMKLIIAPLFLLFFMIPLPSFLYQGLSSELQLISSSLGVWFIRLFGISVFLEGNVIDLGVYKLQVVEACSGLRYLFPLTSLAYMSAYLFKGERWKKILLFASSIPITIFMNSLRIGITGLIVEYWNPSMAKGFMHDFEGWFIFMACMLILVGEIWLLARIGKYSLSFSEAFELTWPDELVGKNLKSRDFTYFLKFVMPVILLVVLVPVLIEGRDEIVPERKVFDEFLMEYPGWHGRSESMEKIYIDRLKFDDYIMSNYTNISGEVVNFYVAYYGSQRKGASVHSPKSCIPGGGWKINEHEVKKLELDDGENMDVNRLYIQNASHKQLVYYWFDQRGRHLTNEYAVKWYLFLDALTKNRTDGSLVRVIINIDHSTDIQDADKVLLDFINTVKKDLIQFIPE